MSDLTSNHTQFRIIGHINSCFPDKFGIPRQSGIVPEVVSEIVINPEWQPELSLQGLQEYSHLWIIFIFHQNTNQKYHAKVHPPRLHGDSIGTFATRSPHRPNPIGLSLVKIKSIDQNRILFYGGDLVQDTPVLDIKPYLPQFESVPDALQGFTQQEKAQDKKILVEFSKSALEKVLAWQIKKNDSTLRLAIEKILKQDPRPLVYKGYEQQASPYKNQHAFKLYDADIHFQFLSEEKAVVIDILF